MSCSWRIFDISQYHRWHGVCSFCHLRLQPRRFHGVECFRDSLRKNGKRDGNFGLTVGYHWLPLAYRWYVLCTWEAMMLPVCCHLNSYVICQLTKLLSGWYFLKYVNVTVCDLGMNFVPSLLHTYMNVFLVVIWHFSISLVTRCICGFRKLGNYTLAPQGLALGPPSQILIKFVTNTNYRIRI